MSERTKDYYYTGLEIAVIGMSIRIPKARTVDEYWDILKNGRETISIVPDEELLKNGVDKKLLDHPQYVKAGSYLEDKDRFDSIFFDYLPGEARIMDPQMRIFHEVVWEALEDAGYNPDEYNGLIGLFAGAGSNYNWQSLAMIENRNNQVDSFSAQHLNNKDFMTTKISYKLNLKGPSVFVQTACSTSLAAVHVACRSILMGECHIAVAGGVTVLSTPKTGYLYTEGMVLSPDGHCRPFDANAKGTVFGEGAGAVVLKRLKNALTDGDNIHAVIKGSAMNNDGSRKVGYTAPSVEGQAEVIRMAQKIAKVEPETISYIEAHGTGTALGDPIEVEALNIVFGKSDRKYCALGSVKANIGHLDTAAGVLSLVKVILALKYRMLPPSVNFTRPNPEIKFSDSPFYVNTTLKKWTAENGILRAGVSSLGIGGTNVHVIVEGAPENKSHESSRDCHLMLFSAKTPGAVDRMIGNLGAYLENHNGINPADVAYTLQKGRKHFPYRRFIVLSERENAIELLKNTSGKGNCSITGSINRAVVFLFTGQGSQYADMGRNLYRKEKFFREEMDSCFETVYEAAGLLKDSSLSSEENIYRIINNPEYAQIALFSFEYALARYLNRLGIKPDIVFGHSLGEYVAACVSGIFTLEEAIRLVATRGMIMNTLPRGSMLSVSLSEHELSEILDNYDVSLAAVNGSRSCVLSGDSQVIDKAESKLLKDGVACQRLHTNFAFHSKHIEKIIPIFKQELSRIRFKPPQIPVVSSLTGKFIGENEISTDYWCKQLRNTVRFSDGVITIIEGTGCVFIEVGPGKALSSLARQHVSNESGENNHLVTNTIRHPMEDVCDQYYFISRLGELWSYGLKINWDNFYYNEKRKRISIPAYPFEDIRYPATGDPYKVMSEYMVIRSSGKKPDISEWFYIPSWVYKPLALKKEEPVYKISLVLGENTELTHSLTRLFRQNNEKTIEVIAGEHFKKVSKNHYIMNIAESEHYYRLADSLKTSGCVPGRVIHTLNVHNKPWSQDFSALHNKIKKGFYSLFNLIKALKKSNILAGVEIVSVTNDLHRVLGTEKISPEKSLAAGFLKVLSQEYPSVKSLNIDISLSDSNRAIINSILEEVRYNECDKTVAYRNKLRWVQHCSPVNVGENTSERSRIKRGGTYLVVGGLGKLGTEICRHLINKYQSRVIIFGRSDLSKDIKNNDDFNAKKKRLTDLYALAKDNVSYFCGDITRYQDIKNCLNMIEKNYGTLDGVIYAAGILKGKSIEVIEALTEKEFAEQFDSKIYGLLALKKALGRRYPDFCIIVSSLSSILGGLRYAAYAAANTFIDYFVQYVNNKKWIVVNLDGLDFDTVSTDDSGLRKYSIDRDEAVDVFDRIINRIDVSQVIVSTGELQERIDKWVRQQEEGNQAKVIKEIAMDRPHISSTYQAPSSDVEKRLERIWKSFFGLSQVGIDDNFFELGGDSLKAVTISKRIYEEFGFEISLAEFFNNLNIRELAAFIENKTKTGAVTTGTGTVITNTDAILTESCNNSVPYFDEWDQRIVDNLKKTNPDIQEIYPLSYMQLTALNYNLMYSDTEYTVQVVTCLLENLDVLKFKSAWKKVVELHPILRTEFIWRKLHAPVQVIYKDVLLPFRELDWRDMPGEQQDLKVKEYVKELKMNKFKKAPLMNVTLIRLNDRQHRLIWCYQNMLFDGWSTEIILNNLIAIYNNMTGRSEKTIKKPYTFSEYIKWLYQKDQKSAEIFWAKEFEGLDYSSSYYINYKNKEPVSKERELLTYSLTLTEEEKDNIRKFAAGNNLSLNTLIVASWAILHSLIESKKDLIVGVMYSGRPLTLEGMDTMAGLFTNILPVRIIIPNDSVSLKWLLFVQNKLHRIKEFDYVSLSQIANWCRIPYETLRKAVYERTAVYVDYPTDETIQIDGISDYASQGGLLVPIRFITGPGLNFCIKYDKSVYCETSIASLLDKMRDILLSLCALN